jgi:hypothetical protein
MKQLFLLCALGCLLAGCPARHQHQHIAVTRQVRMSLFPPSMLQERRAASQILTTNFRGKAMKMYMQVEVDESRMAIVGLTPIGVRLYSLLWDGKKVSYKPQPFFRAPIQPVYVLADFQLTFMPLATLQSALQPKGLSVSETTHKGKLERHFRSQNKLVIRIRYEHPSRWRGSIAFTHVERGYTLTIQTTQSQVLPTPGQTPGKQ